MGVSVGCLVPCASLPDRIDLVGVEVHTPHFAGLPEDSTALEPPLQCIIDFVDELHSLVPFDSSVVHLQVLEADH